jgi:hypothetical protein
VWWEDDKGLRRQVGGGEGRLDDYEFHDHESIEHKGV